MVMGILTARLPQRRRVGQPGRRTHDANWCIARTTLHPGSLPLLR
jgi:hypothetical protein